MYRNNKILYIKLSINKSNNNCRNKFNKNIKIIINININKKYKFYL